MRKGAVMHGKRYTVSVPEELVGPLEAAAERDDRSVSGQIVNIIRNWVGQRRPVEVSDKELASLKKEAAEAEARGGAPLPTLDKLIERSYVG